MASRPAGWVEGRFFQLALFNVGMRTYLIADGIVPSGRVVWPVIEANSARGIMQHALTDDFTLGPRLRLMFPAIPAFWNHELADSIATMISRNRMFLFDLGVPPPRQHLTDIPTNIPPVPDRSITEKVGLVITGLRNVPLSEIGADGQEAFRTLLTQMTECKALVTMMVTVFAAWVAAQATGVIGLVLDAGLFALAIYSIGTLAFDWFHRLGGLLTMIIDAKTDADLAKCSSVLANLIVQIGVSAFISLLIRAAGKRIGKALSKKEDGLPPSASNSKSNQGSAPPKPELTDGQKANLGRYEKKLPANAGETTIQHNADGSITMSATSPGKVPGSSATYTKTVDSAGNTTAYTKTTIAPDGSVVHVKDKLNP